MRRFARFYSNAVDRRLLLLEKAVRDGVVENCKAPGHCLSTAIPSKCRALSRMIPLVRENYLQSRGIGGGKAKLKQKEYFGLQVCIVKQADLTLYSRSMPCMTSLVDSR